MVDTIASQLRETATRTGAGQLSARVRDALCDVPRHEFVPEALQSQAYADRALPLSHGQTISQPFIVALSTELASVGDGDVVLDVGTGCGYQAAVLARLARHVHSLELIPALAHDAGARLERLGFHNVTVHVGDGWLGLPEHAPYGAIVVAATAPKPPEALLAQLAPGARLVVPVLHDLLVITKDADGGIRARKTLPVSFVPLRRGDPEPD